MKIFFYGKNPKISRLEVRSYFESNKINVEDSKDFNKYEIFELENEDSLDYSKIIADLGGTVRIADYIGTTDSIYDNVFDHFETYLPKKYNYALSSIGLNSEERENIVLFLKSNAEGSKAVFKNVQLKSEFTDPKYFHQWNLDEGLELIVIKRNDTYLYSKGIASTNPKDYKSMDEKRPSRFFTHGTSFRLARMMVNILGLEVGKTFVDPFCGTGTFLIEGMIKGNNTIGIDNDPDLINSAIENVRWAKKTFNLTNTAAIIEDDSREAMFEAQGCVFEPYMGPFLKSLPKQGEASEIIRELNELYEGVFKNLSTNLEDKSKIICILPDIETNTNNIIPIDKSVFLNNGLRLLEDPVEYMTSSGSKIRRNLYVLELIK